MQETQVQHYFLSLFTVILHQSDERKGGGEGRDIVTMCMCMNITFESVSEDYFWEAKRCNEGRRAEDYAY